MDHRKLAWAKSLPPASPEHWPVEVVSPYVGLKRAGGNNVKKRIQEGFQFVVCFATGSTAWMRPEDLKPFEENFEIMKKQRCVKKYQDVFLAAVTEAFELHKDREITKRVSQSLQIGDLVWCKSFPGQPYWPGAVWDPMNVEGAGKESCDDTTNGAGVFIVYFGAGECEWVEPWRLLPFGANLERFLSEAKGFKNWSKRKQQSREKLLASIEEAKGVRDAHLQFAEERYPPGRVVWAKGDPGSPWLPAMVVDAARAYELLPDCMRFAVETDLAEGLCPQRVIVVEFATLASSYIPTSFVLPFEPCSALKHQRIAAPPDVHDKFRQAVADSQQYSDVLASSSRRPSDPSPRPGDLVWVKRHPGAQWWPGRVLSPLASVDGAWSDDSDEAETVVVEHLGYGVYDWVQATQLRPMELPLPSQPPRCPDEFADDLSAAYNEARCFLPQQPSPGLDAGGDLVWVRSASKSGPPVPDWPSVRADMLFADLRLRSKSRAGMVLVRYLGYSYSFRYVPAHILPLTFTNSPSAPLMPPVAEPQLQPSDLMEQAVLDAQFWSVRPYLPTPSLPVQP